MVARKVAAAVSLLLVLVPLTEFTLGVLGEYEAERRLMPVGKLQWPGLVISHQHHCRSDLGSDSALQHLRFARAGETPIEMRLHVGCTFLGQEELGFVAGLDVDDDPLIEIVHCDRGGLQGFIEPDPSGPGVITQSPALASLEAAEVCADFYEGRASAFWVGLRGCCCFLPMAGAVWVAALLLGRPRD